jgi:hypothetical protein
LAQFNHEGNRSIPEKYWIERRRQNFSSAFGFDFKAAVRIMVGLSFCFMESPNRAAGIPRPIVYKRSISSNLACGNSSCKGLGFRCRVGWKHTPENRRENPEPNPASKGIETERLAPV